MLFKDVADEAVRRVLAVIAEKNPDLPEAERAGVARQVGLGALAYAMLSVDNNKDIVFDMDAALNFDGHTGALHPERPRARQQHPEEGRQAVPGRGRLRLRPDLARSRADRPDLALPGRGAASAPRNTSRCIMASYAYDLASAFHSFYHVVPVMQAEDGSRARWRACAWWPPPGRPWPMPCACWRSQAPDVM